MIKIKSVVIFALTIIVGIPLFMLIVIIGVVLCKNLITLKTAVKESELVGKSYILCQRVRVTGFDWILIKNEKGERTEEYLNIIGIDPFYELNLRYDFIISNNTYVFYITEKRKYYSEEMRENILEYVATGWDILYPVDRDGYLEYNLFGPRKYITKNDVD
jgi:hypothetical protein